MLGATYLWEPDEHTRYSVVFDRRYTAASPAGESKAFIDRVPASHWATGKEPAVAQDIVLGQHLADLTTAIRRRPLLVLCPSPEAVRHREAARGKTAYDHWTVHALDAELRHRTPRIGLWLDTSRQNPAGTVAEIRTACRTKARSPREDTRRSTGEPEHAHVPSHT